MLSSTSWLEFFGPGRADVVEVDVVDVLAVGTVVVDEGVVWTGLEDER